MVKELEGKDSKYIQLMEKLKQNQDQFKNYEKWQEEEMVNYVSKDEHKQEMGKLQQVNQELMKQIKKLYQAIEQKKVDDEKMKKVIQENSSLDHGQLMIIKEYNDISKRMAEYDDDDLLKNNKVRVISIIDRVLKDYDNLVVR
jgi:hypothetical protein